MFVASGVPGHTGEVECHYLSHFTLADVSVSAYRASTYLDSLLERGAIAPEANAQLDEIYARYRAPSIPAPPAPGAEEKPAASPLGAAAPSETAPSAATSKMDMRPLLTREAVPSILALFGLPESSAGDMYRAIEQTRQRSSKAD